MEQMVPFNFVIGAFFVGILVGFLGAFVLINPSKNPSGEESPIVPAKKNDKQNSIVISIKKENRIVDKPAYVVAYDDIPKTKSPITNAVIFVPEKAEKKPTIEIVVKLSDQNKNSKDSDFDCI